MFNTYSDAAPGAVSERRADKWESLLNEKIGDVVLRLRTPEGALKHLLDYEDVDACAAIISCLLSGNTLGAMRACDNLAIKQAKREAEKEWGM